MKNMIRVLLILFALLLLSSPSMAADNSITTNPLSLIFGVINLDYERILNENFSINIAGSNFSVDDSNFELSGSTVSLSGKYYFSQAQYGSYAGLGYTKIKISSKGSGDNFIADLFEKILDKGNADGFSLSLGHRKVFDSGFTFDTGISWNALTLKDGDNITLPMYWFTIGYGWGKSFTTDLQ